MGSRDSCASNIVKWALTWPTSTNYEPLKLKWIFEVSVHPSHQATYAFQMLANLCKSQEKHFPSLELTMVPRMLKTRNFIDSDFKYFKCHRTEIY